MKKFLLVLGMITCMAVGMTGCGTKEAEAPAIDVPEEQLLEYADQLVESIAIISKSGMKEQYKDDALLMAAIDSWESAAEDMGDYKSIDGHEVKITEKMITVNVMVTGSLRPAVVEVLLNPELMVTSITTNVTYSFGELMEKAALNTVLGMGTVFAVLILISFIISGFAYIPKLQEKLSRKKESAPVSAEAAGNTIAQIIEKEELSDDLELVAVIAAAIAASEGAASTDGFVVRSIRRAR